MYSAYDRDILATARAAKQLQAATGKVRYHLGEPMTRMSAINEVSARSARPPFPGDGWAGAYKLSGRGKA